MLVVLAGFLLVVMLIGGLQSCSALVGAAGGGVAASSYQSEDADILAAEAAYCALEAELQEYLDTYERTHDYDEYHYNLDEIKHDHPMSWHRSSPRCMTAHGRQARCKGRCKCSLKNNIFSRKPS